MEAKPYTIKIPVFEGPLELLLHLIRKNEIDIYDIPIALITRQYLEYLQMMKELNLEVAGEFLVMAATLVQIKSKMLLPRPQEAQEGGEAEDPRAELVERLLQYQALKEAALALKERGQQWAPILLRPPEEPAQKAQERLYLFDDLSLFDLLGAFKELLKRTPPEVVSITRESLTVKDRISAILESLEGSSGPVRFEQLFPQGASRAMLVVTFLALLEVLRLGLARVYQEGGFGPIWVQRTAQQAPAS
jgi:segregation and condensation protein A